MKAAQRSRRAFGLAGLVIALLSGRSVHAQAPSTLDARALALASQPSVPFGRGGTLGMPSPSSLEGVVAAPTGSFGVTKEQFDAALGVFARLDNYQLTPWCSLGFTAESAAFDQPVIVTPTGAMAPVQSVESTSLQTVGLRVAFGATQSTDAIKRQISACCGSRVPGYTPTATEKTTCEQVGIDMTLPEDGCQERELIQALSKTLSGLRATLGLRAVGSDGDPALPGAAGELTIGYSGVHFGVSLVGYVMHLDDYRSPVSESRDNRPGNWSGRGGFILHSNFGGALHVIRLGAMGALTHLRYDDLASESVNETAWEGKVFFSFHGGGGFQGSLTLGALKPLAGDAQFSFGLLPSVGSSF